MPIPQLVGKGPYPPLLSCAPVCNLRWIRNRFKAARCRIAVTSAISRE